MNGSEVDGGTEMNAVLPGYYYKFYSEHSFLPICLSVCLLSLCPLQNLLVMLYKKLHSLNLLWIHDLSTC